MLRLASRNLLRRPLRSALSVVGIAAALALVVGLVSFAYGVKALLDGAMRQIPGLVVVNRGAPHLVLSQLPAALIDELEATPGVVAVVPEVWHAAITIDGGTLLMQTGLQTGGLGILGTDLERRARLPGGGVFGRAVVEGRFLVPADAGACVLSRAVAKQLGKPIGATLRLPGAAPLEVVGLFETGSLIFDSAVIVPVAQVRAMKRMPADQVSTFYLELADPAQRDRVAAQLTARFQDVRAFTPDEINRTLGEVLEKLDRMLLAIAVLPIIGAAVAVLNTMLMSYGERIGEVGVLKACGWRRRDVLALILAEALCLGGAGGAAGALGGHLATAVAASYLAVTPVAPPWLHPTVVGLAVALGAAGGLYPAWKAARLEPMEAIRRG